jgi:general secretion pathway protein D
VTGGDYHFLLQALETSGRLEVLSRPQIVTADNRPATINIGQRVPLITDSRVTERGDTVNSFRYEDIGVNLSVTPKISPDGFVTMEIGTTNSALSSSSVQINEFATVPIINQRRANTTVSVQKRPDHHHWRSHRHDR